MNFDGEEEEEEEKAEEDDFFDFEAINMNVEGDVEQFMKRKNKTP